MEIPSHGNAPVPSSSRRPAPTARWSGGPSPYPFQIGQALMRGIGIWISNLPKFVIIMALVFSPFIAWTTLHFQDGMSSAALRAWLDVHNFAGTTLSFVGVGAIIHAVFRRLQGEPASIGQGLKTGFARFFPILLVVLVAVLVFFVPAYFALAMVNVAGGPVMAMFVVIGLLVYGAILVSMWWLIVPVAVVERPGIAASLTRSAELTKGRRFAVFALVFVLKLTMVIVGVVAAIMLLGGSKPGPETSQPGGVVYVATILSSDILLGSLEAVVLTVAYHDLRREKEGIDVKDLVRVFD